MTEAEMRFLEHMYTRLMESGREEDAAEMYHRWAVETRRQDMEEIERRNAR